MKRPTVTVLEMAPIERVLCMQGGYVLGFSNATFRSFFADLGIDIERAYPNDSKARRLRAFLAEASDSSAAATLEALLDHRQPQPDDHSSGDLAKYRNTIARLRGAQVSLAAIEGVDVVSLTYVHELSLKADKRLSENDLDGAITVGRTMVEAVCRELELRLLGENGDHKGDLQKAFKAVAKQLRIDDERPDLDDGFKQVARGLVQIVNGITPIRNRMSDGHARHLMPAPHHARVVVNAAKTVATFLVESYVIQRQLGLLPPPRAPGTVR